MTEPDAGSPGEVVMPFDPERCPFTAAWRVIGGKWKGVLWWRLSLGMGRFLQLRRSIPQMSKKVLAQELKDMEKDGLLLRRVVEGAVPHVEYLLTDHGRSLAPVVEALCDWGRRHLDRRSGVGDRIDSAG